MEENKVSQSNNSNNDVAKVQTDKTSTKVIGVILTVLSTLVFCAVIFCFYIVVSGLTSGEVGGAISAALFIIFFYGTAVACEFLSIIALVIGKKILSKKLRKTIIILNAIFIVTVLLMCLIVIVLTKKGNS